MLPSSRTTVPETGMIVSGESLPVSSAKKCEKSRKLCAGKQVKQEDEDEKRTMARNAGGSVCDRRQIAQRSRCLPHLRGSFSSILVSQMHFLVGVQHITTVRGFYHDALIFLGEDWSEGKRESTSSRGLWKVPQKVSLILGQAKQMAIKCWAFFNARQECLCSGGCHGCPLNILTSIDMISDLWIVAV